MAKLVVNGGKKVFGEVVITGAKNSVLPLFAAAVLIKEPVRILNVPDISDVKNMLLLLESLGAETSFDGGTAEIDAKNVSTDVIGGALAKVMRSSVFLMGSVLSRMGSAKVSYPGGCDIGLRPIDIHIKALRDLGVGVEERSGYVICKKTEDVCGEVVFDYPSVGATENVILTTVVGKGITRIHNAALEPEIVDLANFLNKMGAKIVGAGTSVVTIAGVDRLHGGSYRAMPDRIVGGTYALAAAITGGEVTLVHASDFDMRALLSKLAKNSCNITVNGDIIKISAKEKPLAFNKVTTRPHPGFPTDLQAPLMALATISEGTTVFCENVFENRYRHVGELVKMGARVIVDGKNAIVSGVKRLSGAEVYARDLRGGAALVLAGLNAEGRTSIFGVEHVDRGYERIDEVMRSLGADIRRV